VAKPEAGLLIDELNLTHLASRTKTSAAPLFLTVFPDNRQGKINLFVLLHANPTVSTDMLFSP